MTNTENSPESRTSETKTAERGTLGRKGGAVMGAERDMTGTTSERSRARLLLPIIIVILMLGWFFFVRSQFPNATRDRGTTSNPADRANGP